MSTITLRLSDLRRAYDLAFLGDVSCRAELLRELQTASAQEAVRPTNLLKEIRAMWAGGLQAATQERDEAVRRLRHNLAIWNGMSSSERASWGDSSPWKDGR